MKYQFLPKEKLPRIPELPDPFLRQDGSRVCSVKEWEEQRTYLKEMLAHYLYGHMPEESGETKGEVIFSRPVYHGKAVAENVRITAGRKGEITFDAELIRPVGEGRVPVFTWNQFTGRHGCPEEEELVVNRGYAIMEFDKAQLAPDNGNAVRGQAALAFPECDWGAVAMWAWGQSRLVDYLLTTEWADPDRLIATGHSRGGKTALCAAIYDDRFALCAPNGSGCGGAGCFRFLGGRLGEGTGVCETAGSINDEWGYWWSDHFGEFGERRWTYTRSTFPTPEEKRKLDAEMERATVGKTKDEDRLPFDMHFARALIAPRAVISMDALGDTWANTYGTQVVWRAAQEVFRFLGVPQNNAMHFRDGKHEFQGKDWLVLADYCDEIFRNGCPNENIICYRADTQTDMMRRMGWEDDGLHRPWSAPE
ncbi:MAG: hypothetical protein LUH19_10075 [Lachnospiraceae bacterium]|nr:hypothetical protein [Lachnospiraceae bacterium]